MQYLALIDLDTDKLELIIYSLIVFFGATLLKMICKRFVSKISNERTAYNTFSFIKVGLNLFIVVALIVIWGEHIKNFITLISFLSAGVAIAIRDIILNWFCGLYIRTRKPFKLEDRIIIDGIKGDVIDLSLFSFDILEVANDDDFGQSTGIIIHMPNSVVFSTPIKNMTKNFKYIWNEIDVEMPIDADIVKARKCLYKIINNVDIVKNIPKKMKSQIDQVHTSYRIYYNNYEPVIYTKIKNSKIILSIRYPIHPKKARYVSSIIWNKIYEEYQNGEILLYKSND